MSVTSETEIRLAPASQPETGVQPTSRQAVLYTIRELGRRAGATANWIRSWRVEFGAQSATLYPQQDSTGGIRFPFCSSKPAQFRALAARPPATYRWMQAPERIEAETVPDFRVFFDDATGEAGPLFQVVGPETIECRADILTSTLWTLCRFEEALSDATDGHGRFPAAASVLSRYGCLTRPIVDEYALGLRQALRCLFPGWSPMPSVLRVKLSHDIDLVGLPCSLRSTVGHLYPRRLPGAFFQDALSFLGIRAPAYLEAVFTTARISIDRQFDSCFYWKACARTSFDSGYDPAHPRVRAAIEFLLKNDMEIGIHPGYYTFRSPIALAEEVGKLRELVGGGAMGGRQHFLRWRPSTWIDWENTGLAYDSSVGFADAMGFRAGTAVPYHPWLLDQDRESELLEIPLIVMDCTPFEYMRLSPSETLFQIKELVRRCSTAGGVFTLLWHNSSVIESPYSSLYPAILKLLGAPRRYDWKADRGLQALPFQYS